MIRMGGVSVFEEISQEHVVTRDSLDRSDQEMLQTGCALLIALVDNVDESWIVLHLFGVCLGSQLIIVAVGGVDAEEWRHLEKDITEQSLGIIPLRDA